MVKRISKNLNRRIQLLKADINYLHICKTNNRLDEVDKSFIKSVIEQKRICKQLLKEEMLKANIKDML